jgi:hypothetical protein
MHGLIGERLLKQFLAGVRHQIETDAMNETGLPENGGKTTDQPDGLKPENAQGRQQDGPNDRAHTVKEIQT